MVGVFAHIDSKHFSWLSGLENLKEYESSPGSRRVFCKNCGANMPNANGCYTCISAGCFDEDPGVKPELQIFVGSMATWHDLADQPIAYDEFDPD